MSFSDNYRFIGESKEEAIGNVEIWENIYDNSLALGIPLPENYPVEQLHKRSSWKHPGLFELLAAEIQKKTQSNGRIMVFYEYFTRTLMDEVIRRHQIQEKFPEAEIWLLPFYMKTDIHIKICVHKLSIQLQTEHMSFMYILNQKEKLIKEYGINPGQKQESNQVAFQPPEVYNVKLNIPISLQKVDVFSLGITLLEMCTLDSPAVIYNISQRSINCQYIENFLQNIQQNYSQFLVQLIKTMIDFQDRPTINDIRKTLQPYVNQIKIKQQFFPQTLNLSQLPSDRPQESQYLNQQKLYSQNSYQQTQSQIKFEDQQQQIMQNPMLSRPYDFQIEQNPKLQSITRYEQDIAATQSNNIQYDMIQPTIRTSDQAGPNSEVSQVIQKSQDILNQLSRN